MKLADVISKRAYHQNYNCFYGFTVNFSCQHLTQRSCFVPFSVLASVLIINTAILLQVTLWSQLCSLMWRTTCSSPKRSPSAPSWWCPNSKMGKSSKQSILLVSVLLCYSSRQPVSSVLSLRTAATWKACCREPTTQSTAWPRACSPATSTRPCT